ncbi:MAG: sugar ABC transporter substrate-binding protein [Chloroflexota bacterium]
MMNFNRIAAVAVALLLGVQIVGAQDVTVSYLGPWGGDAEGVEAEIAAACAADLGINVEYIPFAGGGVAPLMTELRGLATANEMPDVFWMSSGFVDEFANDGLLYNMQPLVDAAELEEDYFAAAFNAGRFPSKVDGDMYAFPIFFVETILYYNRDHFDAAGIDYPTSEWTWDDFLAASQALTFDENEDGLTDQYGYYFFGRYAHVESWVYQNNGSFLSEDRRTLEPSPEAVETVEFLNSLISEFGVAPTPAEVEGLDNPFRTGLVSMWIDGIWNIGANRDVEGLNFGISTIPRGPQWQEDVAYGWADMVSISASSENPEAAFELVTCLSGENRVMDPAHLSFIPSYRLLSETDEWLQADQQPENKALLLEWAESVGPTTFTPGWGEWRGYVGGAGLQGQLDEIFNGNADVEGALAAATETANEVLARFYGE